MKSVQLSLLTLLLHAAGLDAKTYQKNVLTYEILPGAEISGDTITFEPSECEEGLKCTTTRACSKAGYTPSLSEDKKHFACCAAGQRLLGSPDTAFDCCAEGHDLAGDSHCGYHCCPTGFTFDGKLCKEKLCENGKDLVDGKCVCPKDTTESEDGTCQKPKGPDKPEESCQDNPGKCTSGLETGKCYFFKGSNGYRLGLATDGYYYPADLSALARYGRFKFCLDENCAPGKPINPTDEIFITDTYGDLVTNTTMWLNNNANGIHVGYTPNFALAGHFSITKWTCGKYCLGGFTAGLGPACPALAPGMSFVAGNPTSCIEFELMEVPCDLKSSANNCMWDCEDCSKTGCGKTDCSNKGK